MSETEKQTIGRYELMRRLGRGSQGSVYLALDPKLERRVAIKVLTATDEMASRNADGNALEGLIASKLQHPNIVPVFDAGECAIGPYLVFDYVEGESLRHVLQTRGAFGVAAAMSLIERMLSAMAAAHNAGIVHLDLSPNNILLDDEGVPKVMDFGLSQFVGHTTERNDTVTGTLRYMAPEHFLGGTYGPGTDVFALGSICYEIVTGRHAMSGADILSVQRQIVEGEPDLSGLDAVAHGREFATFLHGALEPSTEARYADAAAMYEAFGLFLTNTGLAKTAADSRSGHSTIDFLLRRMQRRQDFPAISATLAEINRLTGADASASADQLANVILRDVALTSKLLKLVNSSFYGARASEITSISEAVVFLGVEQVRMVANSLTLFGRLKGNSADLKDAMIRALLSGLIARHLARRVGLVCAEEAFIGGLCQNLGELLTIYYFAEDYEEIETLRAQRQLDKNAAARAILGVAYADLGAAVARSWNLPATLIDTIKGLPPGKAPTPANEAECLRGYSVFANRLTDVFHGLRTFAVDAALDTLGAEFAVMIDLDPVYRLKLINAGLEKLKLFSQHFELDVARSRYCQSIEAWLNTRLAEETASEPEAKAQHAG